MAVPSARDPGSHRTTRWQQKPHLSPPVIHISSRRSGRPSITDLSFTLRRGLLTRFCGPIRLRTNTSIMSDTHPSMSTVPASLHQRARVTSQALSRSIMIRTSSTQWKFHTFHMLNFRMPRFTLLPLRFRRRRSDRPLFICVLQPDTFAHLCNIVTKKVYVTSVFPNSCSWAQTRLMCKQVVAGCLPFSVCRRASNAFPSFCLRSMLWCCCCRRIVFAVLRTRVLHFSARLKHPFFPPFRRIDNLPHAK